MPYWTAEVPAMFVVHVMMMELEPTTHLTSEITMPVLNVLSFPYEISDELVVDIDLTR
jgi:delta 1-pyrroline-5-carboxylate dehydrogenase